MRRMSVSRQFTVLLTAFAIAVPLSVGGLAYVLYTNFSTARRVSAEGNRQSDQLFAILGSAAKVQSVEQRLLRQKDADEIERLMSESKAAMHVAGQKIDRSARGTDVAAAFQAMEQANSKCQQFLLHGEYAQAQEAFLTEADPAFEKVLNAIGAMQQMQSRREETATVEAEASSRSAQTTIFVADGIVVLGLLAFGAYVVRKVNRGLMLAVRELNQASSGTASAAAQVSSGSQRLAESAEQQAASIEQTSASSEQVSAMTMRNADSSRLAADKMKHTANSVAEVNERLQQLVNSMNAIQTSSDKVAKIIRTIDEIAFQTNILALNAAVEAARAGESGMGFAVVADEVRNLAHRSAEAARNTAALIEESISSAKDGKSKLDQVETAIVSITGSANEVNKLVEEIRRSCEEQARGIQEVSQSMARMQAATQATAAGAQQSAAAGEELSSQSESLRTTVHGLAEMVGGRAEV
jgi:methyl-accepting chemotaxis protein